MQGKQRDIHIQYVPIATATADRIECAFYQPFRDKAVEATRNDCEAHSGGVQMSFY